MGFFTPWFLAGAMAVGLPVWLHLLKKHKTTPLPFSSLMFFERRTQSSIKHRRLRYLVLFAMRTLLILLVVLAVKVSGEPRRPMLVAVNVLTPTVGPSVQLPTVAMPEALFSV